MLLSDMHLNIARLCLKEAVNAAQISANEGTTLDAPYFTWFGYTCSLFRCMLSDLDRKHAQERSAVPSELSNS